MSWLRWFYAASAILFILLVLLLQQSRIQALEADVASLSEQAALTSRVGAKLSDRLELTYHEAFGNIPGRFYFLESNICGLAESLASINGFLLQELYGVTDPNPFNYPDVRPEVFRVKSHYTRVMAYCLNSVRWDILKETVPEGFTIRLEGADKELSWGYTPVRVLGNELQPQKFVVSLIDPNGKTVSQLDLGVFFPGEQIVAWWTLENPGLWVCWDETSGLAVEVYRLNGGIDQYLDCTFVR